MTNVHTLTAPMIVSSSVPTKDFHLLPAGTTLYFDKSCPEGFTRYKVYVNMNRVPLNLRDLSDATEIDPLDARPMDKVELSRALREYPLTRSELEAILQTGHLMPEEVKKVFTKYLANDSL